MSPSRPPLRPCSASAVDRSSRPRTPASRSSSPRRGPDPRLVAGRAGATVGGHDGRRAGGGRSPASASSRRHDSGERRGRRRRRGARAVRPGARAARRGRGLRVRGRACSGAGRAACGAGAGTVRGAVSTCRAMRRPRRWSSCARRPPSGIRRRRSVRGPTMPSSRELLGVLEADDRTPGQRAEEAVDRAGLEVARTERALHLADAQRPAVASVAGAERDGSRGPVRGDGVRLRRGRRRRSCQASDPQRDERRDHR